MTWWILALVLVTVAALALPLRWAIRRVVARFWNPDDAPYERVLSKAAKLKRRDPAEAIALLRRVFEELREHWPHGEKVVVEPYGVFELQLIYKLVPPLFDAEFEHGDPAAALSVAEWVNGMFGERKDAGWISLQAACLYRLGRRTEAKNLLIANVEHDNATGSIRNMLAWVHDRDGSPN